MSTRHDSSRLVMALGVEIVQVSKKSCGVCVVVVHRYVLSSINLLFFLLSGLLPDLSPPRDDEAARFFSCVGWTAAGASVEFTQLGFVLDFPQGSCFLPAASHCFPNSDSDHGTLGSEFQSGWLAPCGPNTHGISCVRPHPWQSTVSPLGADLVSLGGLVRGAFGVAARSD